MFKRLQKRLTLVCTAITGCILIVMACAALGIAERQLQRRGEAEFISSVRSTLSSLQNQRTVTHAWLSQNEANGELLIYIEDRGAPFQYSGIWDREQRALLVAQAKGVAAEFYSFDFSVGSGTQSQELLFLFDTASGGRYYAAISSLPGNSATTMLMVLKSTEAEWRQIVTQRWLVAGLVLAAILALWLFSWKFTAYAIRPVMENQQQQTAFVSAASHELRTPLAVIQAGIAAVQKAPVEQQEHFMSLVSLESGRMARLIDDMLELAGADNAAWPTALVCTDMEPLLISALERHLGQAQAKQIRLILSLPDQILPPCCCDAGRIQQVLSILTDNAITYTGQKGSVVLSASDGPKYLEIAVTDTGPGIPDAFKVRVFERFFKGDASRAQKDHYGLGLSIAKEIVCLHQGDIYVCDAPEGGSRFVVRLPKGSP